MKKCINCKEWIGDGVNKCPYCGFNQSFGLKIGWVPLAAIIASLFGCDF